MLKLYAWELYFEKKIEDIRNEELIVLKKGAIVSTINYIISFSSNFLVRELCVRGKNWGRTDVMGGILGRGTYINSRVGRGVVERRLYITKLMYR